MHHKVVAAVAGASRAVAAAETAIRVEVVAAEKAAPEPVGPAVSSHGGGSRPLGRCWRCNTRGHIREECATKENDFLAKCARCSGFGHMESTCSSDAAVLAMELPMLEENLTVEAQAFVAKETGKCRVMVGKKVGGGGIGKQVMQYVADSAATCSKLCRQYGCHPEAKGRVVDNVCAVSAVGQAKALTTRAGGVRC